MSGMTKTGSETYWMGHRPAEDGAPANDLLEIDPEWGEPRYPKDIYDRPDYYTGFREMLPETMRTLRAARGNPSAMVTIYRAQKSHAGLNTGDWVTFSKAYAEQDLGEYDAKGPRALETYRVPASTVRYAGDDLMEWGYWGPPVRGTTAMLVEASGDHSEDVMIALRPSDEVCKAIASMPQCAEPFEDIHLTLMYLGDAETDCQGPLGKERIYRALYDFAIHSGYRGLTGQFNGFGNFQNDDEGSVLVGLLDIPGIAEFRTWIDHYLKEHGFVRRVDSHGFTPHITLEFLNDDRHTYLPAVPPSLKGESIVFGSLWLVWGDEWTEITLP